MLLSCLELARRRSVEAVAIPSHVVEVELWRRGQGVGKEAGFGRVSHVLRTEAQRRNEKRALTRSASLDDDEDSGSSTWLRANLRRCRQSPKDKGLHSTPCCR